MKSFINAIFFCAIYFVIYKTFDEILMELDNSNGIRRKWGTRHVMVIFWFITWPAMLIRDKLCRS